MAGTLPFKGEAAMFFQFQSHLDLRCFETVLDAGLFFQRKIRWFCRVYNGLHDRYSNFFQTFVNISETNLKLGLFSLSLYLLSCCWCLFWLEEGTFFFFALWHLCSLQLRPSCSVPPSAGLKRAIIKWVATTLWFPVNMKYIYIYMRFKIIRFLAVWQWW